MLVRLKAVRDRLRSSLFFVPMLFVVGGAFLGEVMLVVDDRVAGLPSRLTATVDSARTVLSVVASATLAFAAIAFSVSLLLISLASSQFSPRVVHGLFRDPFNKRVMGIVIGTFTYCLIVLRAVRGPLEEGGQGVVPSLSILLCVLLGVTSILSIVAFISHSAHSMDVSRILHDVTADAVAQIRLSASGSEADDDEPTAVPPGGGFVIPLDRHGWIQQIDHEAILARLEPGMTLEVDTAAGRYAIPDTPLATAWPTPSDPEGFTGAIQAAVLVGETRTMQQDVTYGVRQLADVALKALSPGINDPTTAQDAMFHLGAVVRELLVSPSPPRHLRGNDGQLVLLAQALSHEDVVALAFDEIRIAAVGQPTVEIYLLQILHLLALSLGDDRAAATAALRRQADLVVETSALADLPSPDHERVRAAHGSRFAP